jgi:hypothetical protein
MKSKQIGYRPYKSMAKMRGQMVPLIPAQVTCRETNSISWNQNLPRNNRNLLSSIQGARVAAVPSKQSWTLFQSEAYEIQGSIPNHPSLLTLSNAQQQDLPFEVKDILVSIADQI